MRKTSQYLDRLSQSGECSPGLRDILASEGAYDRRGMQACTSHLYYSVKRIDAALT